MCMKYRIVAVGIAMWMQSVVGMGGYVGIVEQLNELSTTPHVHYSNKWAAICQDIAKINVLTQEQKELLVVKIEAEAGLKRKYFNSLMCVGERGPIAVVFANGGWGLIGLSLFSGTSFPHIVKALVATAYGLTALGINIFAGKRAAEIWRTDRAVYATVENMKICAQTLKDGRVLTLESAV